MNRGNTLDSHRLIHYTGKEAPEKQHELVEELCRGYFTQGKFIGDRYLSQSFLLCRICEMVCCCDELALSILNMLS